MECLPYPGSKSDVLDGGVVWKLWGRLKHRPRRCFPPETFFSQPLFDGLVGVSAVAREFVFVFYLHRERCGLFVRLSQLLRKGTPFPNNLVPGIHLVHFGAFTFSPSSTSRRLYSAT